MIQLWRRLSGPYRNRFSQPHSLPRHNDPPQPNSLTEGNSLIEENSLDQGNSPSTPGNLLSPYSRLSQNSLRSSEILPLFDAIFAVGFTLLAYSVPEELMAGLSGVGSLSLAIITFFLNGITVLLYWFKLRRLLVIARVVQASQLLIVLISMLTIVVLPKLSALALYYGGGEGNLLAWTPAQLVNVVFLGTLFLFDGFCLLFALSLRRHQPRFAHTNHELETAIHAQRLGFMALLILAAMELLFSWFNNQYVLIVPVVLLIEELIVARRFARKHRTTGARRDLQAPAGRNESDDAKRGRSAP